MIIFEKIRWKNILSTGNAFTEIQLNRSPSTLIVGENGTGKSTILDALCFGLYGKPFRKVKKDQLINSINGREAVVEVEFSAYNRKYKIVRGIKPNILEIYQNNKMINQTAAVRDYQEVVEKNILRMNMKSFTQIIILGSSSFVPFMQLPAAARREVIEDLLDIRVFSTMSALLKDKIAENNRLFLLAEKDISSIKEMMQMQEETQKRLTRDNDKIIIETKSQIKDAEARIKEYEEILSNISLDMNNLIESISDESKVSKMNIEVDNIESKLNHKIKREQKSISFYNENDHCPTCTQEISNDIKLNKINEKTFSITEIEKALDQLKSKQETIVNRSNEIYEVHKKIQSLRSTESEYNSKVKEDKREITLYDERLKDLSNTHNNEVKTIIDELIKKFENVEKQRETIIRTKEVYDIANIILKDTGIKSRIIKQYIPIINALVNKYLASMDFFVKFELNETFEERILSRHRDDFTYESFSEGEKMRIDLALLFTWRTIARMKNSASTNLLILDEVFDASLDTNGCDEFLKIMHNLENANIFVISHKGDVLQDKFRNSIKFEKKNNFSKMVIT